MRGWRLWVRIFVNMGIYMGFHFFQAAGTKGAWQPVLVVFFLAVPNPPLPDFALQARIFEGTETQWLMIYEGNLTYIQQQQKNLFSGIGGQLCDSRWPPARHLDVSAHRSNRERQVRESRVLLSLSCFCFQINNSGGLLQHNCCKLWIKQAHQIRLAIYNPSVQKIL